MSPSILLTDQLRRATHFLDETIDGEVVLLDAEVGSYFGLDAMGVEIWNALEQETLVSALVGMLAARFNEAPGRVAEDVLPFLSQMREHGLISVE